MPIAPPQKFTLYTSQVSVYAQRVNILLHRLQVPFKEVLIPLDRPREPWFLAINPRGMVPVLEIEDVASGRKEVMIESALICHFLLDLGRGWDGEVAARADEIFPQGHDLAIATKRYRQSLFIDTYFAKLQGSGRSLMRDHTEEAQQTFLAAAKELEPFCPQPGHYFAESETISLVEVLVGPFVVRVDAYMRWKLVPDALDRLQVEAPNFYAWMKMLAADEGIKAGTWDEEVQHKYMRERLVKAGILVQT